MRNSIRKAFRAKLLAALRNDLKGARNDPVR